MKTQEINLKSFDGVTKICWAKNHYKLCVIGIIDIDFRNYSIIYISYVSLPCILNFKYHSRFIDIGYCSVSILKNRLYMFIDWYIRQMNMNNALDLKI